MKTAILCAVFLLLGSAANAGTSASYGIGPSDSGEVLRFLRCGKGTLDFEPRIIACKQLIKDKGADSYAGQVLGQIYLEQGDLEKARSLYDQIVADGAGDSWAWAQRGAFFVASGDTEAALKDGEAALAVEPDSAAAYLARCFVRAVANRELEAGLADCDAAFAKVRVDAYMLTTKGFILYRMDRYADAVEVLTSAIGRDRDHVDAQSRYLRGLAQKAQGNATDGDADIAAASRIDLHIADLFARYGVKAS